MDTIHLLVALDQRYLPQLKVLLTSIRLNSPKQRVALYLLHNRFPCAALRQIDAWCRAVGYDFSPIQVEDSLFEHAPVSEQYPREMYYRLLAPRILPDSMERVLYLDPDTLVINPLQTLWERNLDGHLFAAAAHTGKTELVHNVNRIRLGTDCDYFNSGVMLMDLNRCRAEIQTEELFRFVREHAGELVLPDQDVLNALYGNRILLLEDVLFNYDARDYSSYLLQSSGLYNVKWVMEHTVILHFCGRAKPWKAGYMYRFGLLYQHYEQLAGRIWENVNSFEGVLPFNEERACACGKGESTENPI